jgi:tripartite-type tricarboxylate transporter receptor subunit TctC
MGTGKRWTVVLFGIAVSFIIGVSSAPAADFPTRYIDLVIPFGPGGSTDVTVRLYKDKVEKLLGQPTVLMYKPGAGGVIAGKYVKENKPDGYTHLVIAHSTLVLSMLTRKAGYTLDDFTPICTLVFTPVVFRVRADSPYKTMKDFVQSAKTKKMKYVTSGVLDDGHLIIEAIGKQEGFQAIHVPTVGGAEAMAALLGGHVDMIASGPKASEGQLRTLAVSLPNRWETEPDVPTLMELGYPISQELYFSLYGPKGVPKEIVDKIYGAYKKVLETDREEITKRAKGVHQIPRVLGGEQLMKVSRDTYDFYKTMVSRIGAPVNK